MKHSPDSKNRHRGIYILPNMITTAALFCGFISMINAINGNYLQSAWMILFAGIFDSLDGRVARLTKTHSDFGVQYDSLSDVASFGMAPAVLAYTWSLHHFHRIGWATAFLFFVCGALRLARFNVQANQGEKTHFQGLPIPCAAYVIASYVIFCARWGEVVPSIQHILLVMTVALALLMVSNVRYRSFKSLNFKRKESFFVLVGLAVVLFIVASAPSEMVFFFSVAYALSGFGEEIYYRKFAKPVAPEVKPTSLVEQWRVIEGRQAK